MTGAPFVFYRASLGLLGKLNARPDTHVIADHDAARFSDAVPARPERLAADFAGNLETYFVVAVEINLCATAFYRERHFLCHVADGEVARKRVLASAFCLQARGLKCHGRVFFGIEEVIALQVAIALFLASRDSADVGRKMRLHRREIIALSRGCGRKILK